MRADACLPHHLLLPVYIGRLNLLDTHMLRICLLVKFNKLSQLQAQSPQASQCEVVRRRRGSACLQKEDQQGEGMWKMVNPRS